MDIVLNVAFFLKLFCCKDRAIFAYHGDVRHFCLPAYNYTRARTFYGSILTRAYTFTLHVQYTAAQEHIHSLRIERRGFRTLVCFILWGIYARVCMQWRHIVIDFSGGSHEIEPCNWYMEIDISKHIHFSSRFNLHTHSRWMNRWALLSSSENHATRVATWGISMVWMH